VARAYARQVGEAESLKARALPTGDGERARAARRCVRGKRGL